MSITFSISHLMNLRLWKYMSIWLKWHTQGSTVWPQWFSKGHTRVTTAALVSRDFSWRMSFTSNFHIIAFYSIMYRHTLSYCTLLYCSSKILHFFFLPKWRFVATFHRASLLVLVPFFQQAFFRNKVFLNKVCTFFRHNGITHLIDYSIL